MAKQDKDNFEATLKTSASPNPSLPKEGGQCTKSEELTMNDQQPILNSPSQPTDAADFDFNALSLPTNYGETLGVKKMILRVPVKRPNKAEFFRVHPGQDFRRSFLILELKEDNETFLLTPQMGSALPGLSRAVMIYTAIDRQGNVFLIPVPLPNEDGVRNSWHESLAQAVAEAEIHWIRIVANKFVGGYDVMVAQAPLPEPDWPEMTMEELLKIAFRGKIINSLDHPVVQKLLGAV